MITCSCDYCIYQKENECTLQNIEINSDATCETCIHYKIDDYARDRLKEITRIELENRYK